MRTKKNSGGCPGVPRNIGLRLAVGEYILFVDSDDAITPTALEEIYQLAKKFDVDVVHCEKYYRVEVGEKFTTNASELKADAIIKADFVNEPTLMTNDKSSRLKDFANEKFDWTTVTNFLRRDFVAKNKLEFITDIQSFEDAVFAVKFLCIADKILKIPNAIYVYRRHSESVTKINLPAEKRVHRAVSNAGFVLKEFDKIFVEFNKPEDIITKITLFEMTLRRLLNVVLPVYAQIPVHLLDGLIRRELDKVDDKTALTAFLFSRMNIFNVQLNRQGALIQQMNAHIQKQNEIIRQLQQK